MTIKSYRYNGSMCADTIDKKDYVFIDAKIYELPEDNEKVKLMCRQGRLVTYLEPKKKGNK